MKATIFTFILLTSLMEIYSQNFWQQTNGPYGGTVFCLAYSNTGSIFCSTITGGGIYKSTDNGNSWFKVYGNDRNSWSWTVIVDRNNNIFASCSGFGLIKSTDDGNTWLQLNNTLTPQAIAINSANHIFAGLSTGALYRSTNGGINWTEVDFGANGVRKILIRDNGFIYTAFPPFLRMSTDNGDTWVQINYSGMTGGNDLAIDSSGNLLVCNSYGIFRTSNNGANWENISTLGSILSIAVSGNGDYYAGNNFGKIIKSTDYGLNWFEIYNNPVAGSNPGVMDIMIKPDGKIFAGIYYLGLYRSNDFGVSWSRIDSGLTNQRVATVASDGIGKIFAGTFNDGLFVSSDLGNSWIQIGLANKYVFSIGFNGPANIFAYTPNLQGGLFRSTNNGLNWEKASTGLPSNGNIYVFRTINGTIFAATQNGIYKSSNNGDSWLQSGFDGIEITLLENNNSNYLFAASRGSIYRSTNLGHNWLRMDSLGYSIRGLCIHNPDKLYANSGNGNLFRSTNNGVNWTLVSDSISYYRLTCNITGYLFGTDYYGFYRSTNYGIDWTQINTGLTFTDITSLTLDPGGYIYAGTWGAGVFRSVQSTVSINTIYNRIPENFSLSQNYPNPFNPSTKIRFDIPPLEGVRGRVVKLVIYDILGREITTLVNERLNPGTYEVSWDASNYPSGVYFYTLNADEYSESKKMVLVK